MHRTRHRGTGDQVAAVLRDDDSLARRPYRVAGPPDALHAARHRWRRLDLDDEIDRPHVDTELERRRCDQTADLSRLEAILDLDALRTGQRPMMRSHQHLAGELVQRRGESFRDAPAVDEDQRRPVCANQLQESRMDRRPDRSPDGPCDAGPLGISSGWPTFAMSSTGTSIRELELLLLGGVHDRDRTVNRRGPLPQS